MTWTPRCTIMHVACWWRRLLTWQGLALTYWSGQFLHRTLIFPSSRHLNVALSSKRTLWICAGSRVLVPRATLELSRATESSFTVRRTLAVVTFVGRLIRTRQTLVAAFCGNQIPLLPIPLAKKNSPHMTTRSQRSRRQCFVCPRSSSLGRKKRGRVCWLSPLVNCWSRE
eukprot:Rmarinus@m.13814